MSLTRRSLLAASVTLAAPAIVRAQGSTPIRIGEVNSYTAAPAFTLPYRNGLQLAVEQVNNAGGVLGTGFLLRTADRTRVQDYWHTINVEQGGRFDPVTSSAELDDLAAYVNFGIPFPVPPTLDATLVARGKDVFAAQHCDSCHKGPRFTDSGSGNPTLDLGGPSLLHDIGTCVTQVFPDAAHMDNEGHPRAACMFDTPSLNGVSATPLMALYRRRRVLQKRDRRRRERRPA